MRCDETRRLIGALIDDELTEKARQKLTDHLDGCSACAEQLADLRRLRRQLELVRERAPGPLAYRVRAALAAEAATGSAAVPRRYSFSELCDRLGALWRQAAVLAAVCLVTAAATWWAVHTADSDRWLQHDVLSAHVRALLQESPVQVASSEAHTVKPWFAGRLEFAPPVRDFAGEGFPLAGGRLDLVGGKRVGALIYKRRLHYVTVFLWPATGPEERSLRSLQLNGYNLLVWNKAGMTYWAVSDLNEGELRQLQALF